MLKELYKGLCKAVGLNVPVVKADIQEPITRPSLKLFFKPKSSMINEDRRHTEISCMFVYYSNDGYDYTNELYEKTEEIDENLTGWLYIDELDLWIWIDDIEYEYGEALLCVYFNIGVETIAESDKDAELMQELELMGELVVKLKESVIEEAGNDDDENQLQGQDGNGTDI